MFNNLIFFDDFIELWIKLKQRGLRIILSKFSFDNNSRTISSFTDHFEHANWWIIPYLKEHRNFLISGNSNMEYEQYVTENYFFESKNRNLISFGCGEGSHELTFAKLNPHLNVLGYDISQSLIDKANTKSTVENIDNVKFYNNDIYKILLENESVDYFLFNASLHHFRDIKGLVTRKLLPALKKGGLVIINEYVGPNRLNFPNSQIEFCNNCLRRIPQEDRKILLLNKYKTRCYRTGKLRMIISDPSECVDSESIISVLKDTFVELKYVSLGGNILVPTLKHIAHHFVNRHEEIIKELIQKEAEYLTNHSSDYVFAIYQKK
ncbi:MAG: methyltransferase domain-containing protein [Saprospiraceae bacterium]|nr:methyltransferase domain-containing protein [Saprospiraceae bacterium]